MQGHLLHNVFSAKISNTTIVCIYGVKDVVVNNRKCSYVAMLISSLHVCMYILSATYSQGSDFSKLVGCTMPLMSPITINGHPTHESVTSLRNNLQ